MFLLSSLNKKYCIFLSLFSIFFNSKTNAVTNLNPLNSGNKFIHLFLVADLVSFELWFRIKRNQSFNIISTPIISISIWPFGYFQILLLKRFSFFLFHNISFSTQITSESSSVFLTTLNNWWEVFGRSIMAGFMTTLSGFSIAFGCLFFGCNFMAFFSPNKFNSILSYC